MLYQGIARGLNNLATNITACVKDGNHTVQAFKDSFKAFEDRQVIEGNYEMYTISLFIIS